MRNIRLILEYEGTNYHGWQTQVRSGKVTIQEMLEQALSDLAKEPIKTYASGRTDAGVHAMGQVVNFRTESSIPAGAWAPALNHLLPRDIRVLSSDDVNMEFHARHSASGKMYRYSILNRPSQTVLSRNFCWHVTIPLNLRSMRKAATHLIGTHDFSAFRGSGCSAKSPVRTIRSLVIRKKNESIELWIEADAFLQYMVRNIAGTLVDIGLGRIAPAELKKILLSRDRSHAGRTAPPQGLCLVSVEYDLKKRRMKKHI